MKKLRLIKYPGSKWVSIPDIREVWKKSNMEAFADVFGGSATVSLNMGAENVIYNELNTQLYNLLLSLRDSYDSFMEYVKQWLTSPKSFMEFRKQLKEESDEKREDRTYSAFKTFTGITQPLVEWEKHIQHQGKRVPSRQWVKQLAFSRQYTRPYLPGNWKTWISLHS